jgi:hypothetical protein
MTPPQTAADALAALAPCHFHASTRERIAGAESESGHASLQQLYEKQFARDT